MDTSHMNSKLQLHVDSVSISGNKRTSKVYFEKELQEAFHSCGNLVQMKRALERATANMENQQIFEAIHTDLHLKPVEEGKIHVDIKVHVEEKGIPFLKLESSVKASATSPSAALNASILAAARNTLGYGEVVKVSLGTNDPTSLQPAERYVSTFIPNAVAVPSKWLYKPQNAQNRRLNVPLSPLSPITQLDLSITAKISDENSGYFVGYSQHVEALSTELRTRDLKHNLELEISNRDEVPLKYSSVSSTSGRMNAEDDVSTTRFKSSANPFVLCRAATSSKVSAKYSFTAVNSLDSMCSPTKGSLLKGSFELATPLGSAQFARGEINCAKHITLGPTLFGSSSGATLSLCSSFGIILPFTSIYRLITKNLKESSSSSSLRAITDDVNLCDRYHLGGPTSVRGFDLYGVGPKSVVSNPPIDPQSTNSKSLFRPEGISIGSFSRLSGLAMLSVPVPIRSLAKSGAKSFLFLNAGVLGDSLSNNNNNNNNNNESNIEAINSNLNSITIPDFKSSSKRLLEATKLSMGCGLFIPIANAFRLEISYAMPLLSSSEDTIKPFQFGVGITIN